MPNGDNTTPIYLSTLGVRMHYAVETTAGVRPTASSAYTELKGIKTIPALNSAPDNLETTTLNETKYKIYIPGLKDTGGALELVFNLSNYIHSAWDTLMDAYETAKNSGKAIWFYIDVPGLDDADGGIFFPGEPSEMGSPEFAVNSVAEISLYVTPTGEPEYDAKLTDASV